MPYLVNHIHLKSSDPEKTANWFVEAFNVQIMSDTVRDFGDRFIVTQTEGGLAINISNERTGETLGPGDAKPHFGLEHFGFDTDDMDADLARLTALGRGSPRRADRSSRWSQDRLHRRTRRHSNRADTAGELTRKVIPTRSLSVSLHKLQRRRNVDTA